ncbi:helix-turn-helix transcriptional regulator [Nocardia terpenica]|uniref:helix-turn-helix transcriptional regulator n=1 Tax=Nocardia terpenica TaxID=455432 RepID=UPI0018E08954|nr:helix-turn-helix transcriptional regulator [Nocardia terpenica]
MRSSPAHDGYGIRPFMINHLHAKVAKLRAMVEAGRDHLVELPVITSVNCCATTLSSPLDPDTAASLAGAFKALADPVRLRLLSLIGTAGGEEVCVCELAPAGLTATPA